VVGSKIDYLQNFEVIFGVSEYKFWVKCISRFGKFSCIRIRTEVMVAVRGWLALSEDFGGYTTT
jgi:hypothetical protein